MTQQQMPNPVDLYEAAARQTRRYIANVKPAQLNGPTPCSLWNVQTLLDHIVGENAFFASAMSGTPHPAAKATGNMAVVYDTETAKVLKIARAPGALDKIVEAGAFGKMPGSHFMAASFMDTLVHGWDLAKATGQDTHMDTKLTEACYAMFAPQAAGLRASGGFGPEVVVPANADAQTKLLGVLGRKA